jgi:hypothetical protein
VLQESVDLMRIGEAEIEQHRDGIALGGALFELARIFGVMTHDAMADPQSMVSRQGLDMFHERAMSAMAFGWFVSAGNDRAAQIEAGRAYVRANLKATELGLAMHPWSQALQEYPEMTALQQELLAVVKPAPGEHVQMLFRLGYAVDVPPSPRRPLEALIRTA